MGTVSYVNAIPPDATPEEIVEFCINRVTEKADRCVEINEGDSALCVEIIEELLAEEAVLKAQRVAVWCIHDIRGRSGICVHRIRHLCRRCSRAIIRAGGSRELIEEMREAVGDQIDRIQESRAAAVQAIVDVLGEDPELPPPPPAEE